MFYIYDYENNHPILSCYIRVRMKIFFNYALNLLQAYINMRINQDFILEYKLFLYRYLCQTTYFR